MQIFRIILGVTTRKKILKTKKKYFYDMTIFPTKRPFPRYSAFLAVRVVQWCRYLKTPYKIRDKFAPLIKKVCTTTFFNGADFLT